MLAELLTHVLAPAAPLLFLTVGLVPSGWADRRPRLMARWCVRAAWLAFASALATAVGQHLVGIESAIFVSSALPGDLGAFAVGTYVNGVTAIMLVLVSFVGVVVTGYAGNYMTGDANQGRFHKWLALTLAAILTLIVADNLLMFALAWIATSLCLHHLLMFYRERPASVLAAHKKFIASRIGDLSLLVAIFLIGSTLHSLEFSDIFRVLAARGGPLPASLDVAAMLIVLSAALKSAQFPFHGWLIQVMEAPTPVSALLHAGIVNAGAFLVIRMSPIVSLSPTALTTLAVIGLVTLALASLVMLTQTSIKVSLAWSTTAQMGFMLLECGLGLYSLAMLHLVAHSLYKAHAFLASGSGVDAFRAPALPYPAGGPRPGRVMAALAIGTVLALAGAAAFGATVSRQPALLAAAAIVAIAVGQLLLQAAAVMRGTALLVRGLGLGATVSVAYFALHAAFDAAMRGSVLPVPASGGALEPALAVTVVVVFLALLVLQQILRHAPQLLGDGLYVHLYNGLYIDVYITRLLQRVWPSPTPPPRQPPAPFATVSSHGG